MAMSNEEAWDYALGICQVDGAKLSPEFLELVERHKRSEITNDDIARSVLERYKAKEEGSNA